MDEDSVNYFRGCTDRQLENCLADEFKRHKQESTGDRYAEARQAATERGWRVINGNRC